MNPGRRKVEDEGECRVCGIDRERCDAAHLWNRSQGARGFNNPDLIVPLCSRIKGGAGCHDEYDDHRLDLLPYLTRAEEVAVVKEAGIARAYKRVTGVGCEPDYLS